ncbi:MAG: type 1 glutamine amidotransferase [Acidobacteriota bacterium]
MPIHALLLQAREVTDPARPREHRSFAEFSGLPLDRVATHDLLEGPPAWETVRRHDAVLIGGSGEYYVSKGHLPQQEKLFELLRRVVDSGHPTFASCFGFQCMVEALGGTIVFDPPTLEVGTKGIRLTAAGKDDPLFGTLPERFSAQLGRKDRATALPPQYENLAESDLCPFQAFRVPDRPIWASQFHPELDGAENRRRFERYLDSYAENMNAQERAEALAGFRPSPEANGLLQTFFELVFDI